MNKLSEFRCLIDASKAFEKSGAKLIALEFIARALALDLELSKDDAVEIYKLRGKIRFGMDHINQSINDFSYAIEIDPQNPELYYWRGMLYYISNQLNKSLEDFKIGVDFEPLREVTESLIKKIKKKINQMKRFLVNGLVDLVKKSKIINANSPMEAINKFLEVYSNSKIYGVYPFLQDYESNQLSTIKDKWELILSKVELPSTKMLLTQQAELVSFNSNKVEIALSSNWYRFIESRKIIIENAVKKIFGAQIIVQFNIK